MELPLKSFSTVQIAAFVFVVALLARGIVCYLNFDQFKKDPDAYIAIASTLAETNVFGLTRADGSPKPTAFRPPLYPYLLSWFCWSEELSNISVACLHTMLGAATCLCTFGIALRLLPRSGDRLLPIFASLLVMLDPILLQQSTLVMTETLATAISSFAILLATYFFCGKIESESRIGSGVLLGVVMALAYLCRPTFLVWSVLLTGLAFLRHASNWKIKVIRAAVVSVPVLAVLGAWTIRNNRVMGRPIWATSHGGYTLLLANNPSFYDYLQEGRFGFAWDAESFFLAHANRFGGDPNTEAFWLKDWSDTDIQQAPIGMREYEDDRICYDAARATIDREPSMFAWSCLVRLCRLWSPVPHRTPGRGLAPIVAVGTYYFLFYIAVVVGVFRLGKNVCKPGWWPVWTLAITLSCVHAVYWSNLRMRAPVIPAMVVLAVASLKSRRP